MTIAAATGAAAGGLTIAHPFPPGHTAEQWALELGECIGSSFGVPVEPLSNARALNSTDALMRSVREGQLDMAILPVRSLAEDWPEVGLFAVPGMLPEPEGLLRLSTSENLMQMMDERGSEKRGFFLLALGWQYQVLVIRPDDPIADLSDFGGRKIRASSDLQMEFLSRLGAVPILLPTAEVPFAMEYGVIDGAVMNVDQMDDYVQKAGGLTLLWSDRYLPFVIPLAVVMSAYTEYSWGEKILYIVRSECAPVTDAFNKRSYEAALFAVERARAAGARIIEEDAADWAGATDGVLSDTASRSGAGDFAERVRSEWGR